MSNRNLDDDPKLRDKIEEKLEQLEAHMKNDLLEFIMVMLHNRRTKYQMKDELSLFLGKDTDEFVDWVTDTYQGHVKSTKKEGKSKKEKKRKDRSGLSEKSDSLGRDGEESCNSESRDVRSSSREIEGGVDEESLIGSSKKEDANPKIKIEKSDEYETMDNISSTTNNLTNADNKSQESTLQSFVRVPQNPRPSVQARIQPPSDLVLKAVNEANQSVSKKRKNESNECQTKRRLNRIIRMDDTERNVDDLRHRLENKRQAREKNNEVSTDEGNDDDDNEGSQEPHFIVTLTGLEKNERKNLDINQVNEENEDLIFDVDNEDDGLIAKDDDGENEMLETKDRDESMEEGSTEFGDKVKERCKYWPSCKNGELCTYFHPSSECRAFPNCKFGDKCLFIHPECKFDTFCTRHNCPFLHIAKPPGPKVQPMQASNSLNYCRYYPNCTNYSCPFFHPKPCIYGAKCRNPSCLYEHPTFHAKNAANVAKPYQLKWKSNSEKQIEEA